MNSNALSAARVTRNIVSSYETSMPVVVRTSQHEDALAAVDVAIEATRSDRLTHRTVRFVAHQDIHGLGVRLDDEAEGNDTLQVALMSTTADLLTAVVTITTSTPVPEVALPALVSQVQREVEDFAEGHGEFGLRFSQVVHILHDAAHA